MEHVLPEWATEENLAVARAMRGGENDQSYADIAEHFGLPRDQWKLVKDALDAHPAPAPTGMSKLEALAAKAAAMQRGTSGSMFAEIKRARGEPVPTEAETDKIVEIFRAAWPAVSYEDIGEALDPPRHRLTVKRALEGRGWTHPTVKTLPYCTSTPEGQKRLMEENAAGLVDPAIFAQAYIAPSDVESIA